MWPKLRRAACKSVVLTWTRPTTTVARPSLHLAASEGHLDTVRYLLGQGASPDVRDHLGNTPLQDAERGGHKKIAALLTEATAGDHPGVAAKRERTAGRAVYQSLCNGAGHKLTYQKLLNLCETNGLDRCLAKLRTRCGLGIKSRRGGSAAVTGILSKEVSPQDLDELLAESPIILDAIKGTLHIANWNQFMDVIEQIYEDVAKDTSGLNAQYIPSLARVDPEQWGVAVCSTSGQEAVLGDSDVKFCVQSCSKVISYCIAQDLYGADYVHKHVGREPSGRGFNELCLDANRLPHNPCINAGAIMCCSLIKPELPMGERFAYVMDVWADLAGSEVGYDNPTFLSEKATADRNFTLAFMMKEAKAFPDHVNSIRAVEETLEFYFMNCSILATARQMSIIAGTLANGGLNPVTGKRVFSTEAVRNAMSIMQSAGMYDYSGEFAFHMGFPAKSGVGGGLLICIPNVCGFATFSPRLDKLGNTVRGTGFCRAIGQQFNFHAYDIFDRVKKDPRIHGFNRCDQQIVEFLDAASRNDALGMEAIRNAGVDVNAADYDQRTALHVAAAAGNVGATRKLLAWGANPGAKDRWGATPLDEANKNGSKKIIALFQ